MKINWKVRFQQPIFWIGLIGIVLSAMGVEAEMFTSWNILFDKIGELLGNPFMLGSVAAAVFGYFQDPTTPGWGDSEQALTYDRPGRKADNHASNDK